ncbi:hypothetical protein ACQR0V_17235 [Bradyrhizobium sp. HKCCYLS2058]|uniref:hypothetical protein n=1 Tax=unclassified Bradyrhizobium TaxID=2631580 RepID=UPI002916302C|nr:hypothetical protein [Bradyrhizobium sp. SZCCHNRI1009]
MSTIAEGAAALTAAIGFSKELLNLNKALTEAEFKLKIADLTSALATAKIAVADFQDELRQKDAEISALKKAFEFKQDLIEQRGFKYRKNAEGNPTGSAFCPRCEQNKGRFYQLTVVHKPGMPYACPECKAEYSGDVTSYS